MTISQSSQDALPSTVYVDTGFVAAAMMQGVLHHHAAREFCKSLVDSSSHVAFSNLLRVEFLQALVAIGNDPSQLPGRVRRRYKLHRWGNADAIRLRWLENGMSLLDELFDQFAQASEVAIEPAIVDRAVLSMALHKLRSYDAIHVATAEALGIRDIATCDSDFLRVDGENGLRIHLIRDA